MIPVKKLELSQASKEKLAAISERLKNDSKFQEFKAKLKQSWNFKKEIEKQ